MYNEIQNFWNYSTEQLLIMLESDRSGLTESEAQKRQVKYSSNVLKKNSKLESLLLFISQFKSPIIIILIIAAIISVFVGDATNAAIIFIIILLSGLLSFWQESGAKNAVAKLLEIVQIKSKVYREGKSYEIPVNEVVPGDIIILSAGDIIPGDSYIIEGNDLFVLEAALTGESYPVEKYNAILPVETSLGNRANCLWMGTHVVSGTAMAIVVKTGKETEFGQISEELHIKPVETEFERGVTKFGYLLMEVTLVLVLMIFAINVYFHRPVLEAFLFSLALAVGLTPQLLPAIISINLAHGAKDMAEKKVIVKRLASIENFGSMNILCSDKTGTLTEGNVHFKNSLNYNGVDSEKPLFYAYLNASFETGFNNSIDEALRASKKFNIDEYHKIEEIPYDFIRKCLSVLVRVDKPQNVNLDDSFQYPSLMVTKGAFDKIIKICNKYEDEDGKEVDLGLKQIELIHDIYENLGNQGLRVLGVAYKNIPEGIKMDKNQEMDMTFSGFLVFYDPPKKEIVQTINNLKEIGISLKIITGDNRMVAEAVAKEIGFDDLSVITGTELSHMSNTALINMVSKINIFAEVEPNHKERIVTALRKAGNVVGYMGDGINDVSALHSADVSISVDSAVDVAKGTADIVLLEKNLGVLTEGVKEGRRTFNNTLKYIFMASSANFGNMFSMAGVSLFLSFLPLLPQQILVANLLTDFPELTIATDNIDREMIERPRRWDVKFIKKFMLTFGLVSSLYDYITFGVLLFIFKSNTGQFRTGWFIESVISASMAVLIIRTRRTFYQSRPSKPLFLTTLLIGIVVILIPLTPLGTILGFETLNMKVYIAIALIIALYIITLEFVKKIFYK
ncbi:MAG: magnesium-translocating P-type ATPase [Solirubrobacterales bacterium]